MRAHFCLPSVEAEEDEGKPPIKVKFEIPYFTVSGIQKQPFLGLSRHLCVGITPGAYVTKASAVSTSVTYSGAHCSQSSALSYWPPTVLSVGPTQRGPRRQI
eukprot:sb/3478405/